MYKSLKLFILLAVTLFSFEAIIAQEYFEGKVKFKITDDDDESVTMDYLIKDGNFRMEMGEEAEGTTFIYRGDKSFILMPSEKMYMDLDNSLFSKIGDMFGGNDEEDEEETKNYNFEDFRTGKTKDILGYECEQYIFTDQDDDDETVEAWITDEIGNFMMMKNPMGESFTPSWGSSLKDKGYFPLQVITKDEDGEIVSRFEAIEIDKKSLSDDVFDIPSGYEEMKIPGM